MKASTIIAICHLGTAVTAAAAFQPITPMPPRTSVALMAYHHHFHHHPFHNHPFNRRPIDTTNNVNNNNHQQRQRHGSPLSSSTVDAEVLTEAEELLNEQFHGDADGWNERRATKDFRTTKEFRTAGSDVSTNSNNNNGATRRQSEVINFDPEQPIFKPLKSADENGHNQDPFEEQFDDFSKFQRKQNAKRDHQVPPPQRHRHHRPPPGMMPPPPMEFEFEDFESAFFDMPPPPPPHHAHPAVPPHMMPPMDMPPPHFFDGPMMNDNGNNGMFMSENMEEEESYVDRVDFADHGRPVNDRDNTGSVDTFFSDRPTKGNSNGSQQRQQQRVGGGGRRGGPSVYTPEEEELIASMGGMGPPPRPPPPGRPSTQQFAEAGTQSAMRKQQQQAPPPPQYREEGYLGDSTLKEISMDYGVPITYLADVLATWGVPIPIDPNSRLGDMVTGEQAFAILEAIHTLDVAELHERYAEDDLMNLCDYYDLDIKMAFDFCMERGWALPFGVRTFLRVEQEAELLDALAGDDGGMF